MTAGDADAVSLVGRFNDFINAQDLDGLAGLMHVNHRFTDSAGVVVSGKKACLDAWQGFFVSFNGEFMRTRPPSAPSSVCEGASGNAPGAPSLDRTLLAVTA